MLDVTILSIGKIKEKYFAQAINEYQKRLRPYAVIKILELEAVSFNSTSRDRAKEEEGDKMLSFINKNKNKIIIALDEKGRSFSSKEFAHFLEGLNQPIMFVIGGSLGFSSKVLENCHYTLSMSNFTLPHELARVVLFEQLYRSVTIINNKTYHY